MRRCARALLIIGLFVLQLAPATTSRAVDVDVKTKWKEKRELMASKAGLIAYINASRWGRVVEFGEDYAVWILDYRRHVGRGQVAVEMTLELHRPTAAWRKQSNYLTGQRVRVSFPYGAAARGDRAMREAVLAQLKKAYDLKKLAWMLGTTVVELKRGVLATVISFLLQVAKSQSKLTPTTTEVHEGLIAGAKLFYLLERMVLGQRRR